MAEINAKRQNSIPATGLAYPERFYAAVMFVENAEGISYLFNCIQLLATEFQEIETNLVVFVADASLTEETKLLLYSLNQQATVVSRCHWLN